MTAPQKATPGGSGQANADQKMVDASILADIDAARNADKIKGAVITNAALAGLAVCERADGSCICNPVAEVVDEEAMVESIVNTGNRAQRRAAARQTKRGGK